jgi:sec-independent protein translocase protein TatB
MFDMGFTEIMLIGIVALVVIGPERLPGVARTAGKYSAKMRRFMTNVRADVESELRADELRQMLDQQQQELNSLKDVMNDTSKEFSDIAESIGTESTGNTESSVATEEKPEKGPEYNQEWVDSLNAPDTKTATVETQSDAVKPKTVKAKPKATKLKAKTAVVRKKAPKSKSASVKKKAPRVKSSVSDKAK